MPRQCKNPRCGAKFEAKSLIHAFCCDACRKAVRGTEYRKARELAFIRDGYTCTECDAVEKLECHHVMPLCQGGNNSLKNLQTLCRKHHKAKHKSWKGVTAYEPRERESEEHDYAA